MKTDILKEEYIPQIAQIEKETFFHPWSENAFLEELKNENAFYTILEQDGLVLAYGGFWQIFNEAHITNIAVKKEYRHRGLGRQLCTQLIKSAKEKGITAMTLEVRVSNKNAIALYKSLGFTSCGVRPKYYPDGEDALIMWLEEL